MRLDRNTINELVELLKPFLEDEQNRRPFLVLALGNDTPVLQRLTWSGAVSTFITDLVCKLADYGEIEPGKQALWALLESVRLQVGVDIRQRIDKLRPLIDSSSQLINNLLTTDINFISYIILCLETAEKRQKNGKLSTEHQNTIERIKDKVKPWVTMDSNLAELADQAQSIFERDTRNYRS